MVYCTKCGTKNPDDATVCSQCGAPIHAVREGGEYYRRKYEKECFGVPGGGAIVGAAIGLIIVISGLVWFLNQSGTFEKPLEVGPFAAIIIGILIVVFALYGMRRRY